MTTEIAKWNQEGLFPGPGETEEDFVKRVKFCQDLETELVNQFGAELPFLLSDQASNEIKQASLSITQKLYGMAPAWVPVFFSNHQLAPWHGGCAWIFKILAESPTAAFLQLRACFRHKKTFLGLYHREELIPHELAHVGRMMYDEPQFEELLAYRSSFSPWRRFLGPIVQSSRESLFFIALLVFVVLSNLTGMSAWITLIPVGLVALAFCRLMYRRIIYDRCLNRLKMLCDEPDHLIYRLTDEEINRFSRLPPEKIKEFIQNEALKSYRWKFLASIYTTPL